MSRTYRKTYKSGQRWCNEYNPERYYFSSPTRRKEIYDELTPEQHRKQFEAFRKVDGKGYWTMNGAPRWYRRGENRCLRAMQRLELHRSLNFEIDVVFSNKHKNACWYW